MIKLNKQRIGCILEVNEFQKKYLLQHLYTTRRMYLSICRTLYKERERHVLRSKEDMKGLCKETHRAYVKAMDEKELQCMVRDLLQVQHRFHTYEQETLPTYYACTITSKDLIFRNISLLPMLPQQARSRYIREDFLYARMYELHQQLHFDIYVKYIRNLQKNWNT